MKKAILTLGCALIAPLAFAQTSTTTTEQTTTTTAPVKRSSETTVTTAPATSTTVTTAPGVATTSETTTTYSAGTVSTYEPNKRIVVRSDEGPVEFALKAPLRVLDAAGHVVTAPLRSDQKVRVYYTGPREQRVIEHVQVVD